jgi:hypothetical protein
VVGAKTKECEQRANASDVIVSGARPPGGMKDSTVAGRCECGGMSCGRVAVS